MNWPLFFFWGIIAITVFNVVIALSNGLRLTRLNIPYILGLAVTPSRDKAHVYGMIFHFIFGWVFVFIYVILFYLIGFSSWWLGLLLGLLQGSFMLTVFAVCVPSIHPRMANERYGPEIGKQLEPPGFLAMHYGYLTPIVVLIAYMLFGTILGFYQF